jgi:two-component system LytT family sensor kinase
MILARSNGKFIIILAHVLIWALFGIAIFFYHPLFSDIDIPLQAWITQSITLGLLILVFYINATVLVPGFLLKNRVAYYFVMIIAIVAAAVFIITSADKALEPDQPYHPVNELRRAPSFKPGGGRHIERPTIILIALVLGIGTSIAVIQKWQKDKQHREELEKEKVISELSFLKAQINPHFFFNTLNNIYALTAVDAELAGKAIHQLSRMMRYLLDGTQPGHTMLSQEIAFVKDYISLMQLRITDAVIVQVETPPNLLDLPFAPMIFLPFVENAFKHGVSATQASQINIIILQKGKTLHLTVKNTIAKGNNVSLDTTSGIGLANTKRRLDLLYPGKYKLETNELNANNEYTVHLTLDLT